MRAFLNTRTIIFVASLTLAACSGTGPNYSPPPKPLPTVTPAPTATPTTAPGTSTSTISVNGGAALSNQPATVPVPLASGYSATINIPLVSAAAGTTVNVASGTSVPSGLVALTRTGARSPFGLRRFQASGDDAIFYASFEPSANVTVAGDISADITFPAGTLSASSSYYLGFYDSSTVSPAWETIGGPVTPNGNTLTFSGTISSTTLKANTLYGFAIFTTTSSSASPPPAPQTLLYFGNGTQLTIATETGTVVNTLPIPSNSFDLDDAGNIYVESATFTNGVAGPATLSEYPAGSSTASGTYTPSSTVLGFVAASGAGQVAVIHDPASSTSTTITTDVWDPGVQGAPSRELTTTPFGKLVFFGAAHDGTLYLPDTSGSGAPQIDVFAPGASTPTSVIAESIITPAEYQYYSPNYAAVGPDGTLYVTQYNLQQPDPIAGTYIYPANGGAETFIPAAANANGPGPFGVDVDGSGNIYVVNDNIQLTSSGGCTNDTLGTISEYSAAGTLVNTATGDLGGVTNTTTANGTDFLSSFIGCNYYVNGGAAIANPGIFSILPGATSSTQISTTGSTEIVLYDGTHKTAPFARGKGSVGAAGGFARANRLRRLQRFGR